jgi:hypothetical protein
MKASSIEKEAYTVESIAKDICAIPISFYKNPLPDEVYLYKNHIIVLSDDGPYIINKIDTASYFEFLKYEKVRYETIEYKDFFKIEAYLYSKNFWDFSEFENKDYELD